MRRQTRKLKKKSKFDQETKCIAVGTSDGEEIASEDDSVIAQPAYFELEDTDDDMDDRSNIIHQEKIINVNFGTIKQNKNRTMNNNAAINESTTSNRYWKQANRYPNCCTGHLMKAIDRGQVEQPSNNELRERRLTIFYKRYPPDPSLYWNNYEDESSETDEEFEMEVVSVPKNSFLTSTPKTISKNKNPPKVKSSSKSKLSTSSTHEKDNFNYEDKLSISSVSSFSDVSSIVFPSYSKPSSKTQTKTKSTYNKKSQKIENITPPSSDVLSEDNNYIKTNFKEKIKSCNEDLSLSPKGVQTSFSSTSCLSDAGENLSNNEIEDSSVSSHSEKQVSKRNSFKKDNVNANYSSEIVSNKLNFYESSNHNNTNISDSESIAEFKTQPSLPNNPSVLSLTKISLLHEQNSMDKNCFSFNSSVTTPSINQNSSNKYNDRSNNEFTSITALGTQSRKSSIVNRSQRSNKGNKGDCTESSGSTSCHVTSPTLHRSQAEVSKKQGDLSPRSDQEYSQVSSISVTSTSRTSVGASDNTRLVTSSKLSSNNNGTRLPVKIRSSCRPDEVTDISLTRISPQSKSGSGESGVFAISSFTSGSRHFKEHIRGGPQPRHVNMLTSPQNSKTSQKQSSRYVKESSDTDSDVTSLKSSTSFITKSEHQQPHETISIASVSSRSNTLVSNSKASHKSGSQQSNHQRTNSKSRTSLTPTTLSVISSSSNTSSSEKRSDRVSKHQRSTISSKQPSSHSNSQPRTPQLPSSSITKRSNTSTSSEASSLQIQPDASTISPIIQRFYVADIDGVREAMVHPIKDRRFAQILARHDAQAAIVQHRNMQRGYANSIISIYAISMDRLTRVARDVDRSYSKWNISGQLRSLHIK